MALTGTIIIVFFVSLAALAPVLTNVNPIYSTELASPYSVPQWAKIFPAYSSLPVDTQYFTQGEFKAPSSVGLFTYSPKNNTQFAGMTFAYAWNGAIGPSGAQAESYDLANTGPGSLQVIVSNPRGSSYTTFSLSRDFSYDYIFMQKVRGIPGRLILYKHALRNSILPVISQLGIQLARTLTGAVIAETVFSFQGLGYTLFQAVENQDFPTVQAIFFIVAVMVIVGNFLVDLVYGYIDPRIRYK